jgi:hypothetical protein
MIRTRKKTAVIKARVILNYNFQQSCANKLAISHQSELGAKGMEVLRARLDPSRKTNKCLSTAVNRTMRTWSFRP